MRETLRPWGRRLGVVCVLLGWLMTALPAFAGPADCDGELTDGQKTQRSFCETHVMCAFVFSIFDSCVTAKKWLNALPFSKNGSAITNDAVIDTVRGMRSVELLPDPDAPTFSDCLPGSFDRARCRIYLGVDKPRMPAATITQPPAQLSPDTQRRARVLALYKEAENSRARLGTPYGDTVIALNYCSEARHQGYRDKRCAEAQRWVQRCNAFRDDWLDRKAKVLAEISLAEPGVGEAYTPGTSPLRGLGRQANAAEMWNDTVRGLKSLEIAGCPSQVGDAGLTPDEALATWEAEDKQIPGNSPRPYTPPPATPAAPVPPPPTPSYPSYPTANPAPSYTPPATRSPQSNYTPPASSYTPSSTPAPVQSYSPPPQQIVTTKTPVPPPIPKPAPVPKGPKYYPNLNCITVETDKRGSRCGRNRCGSTVEMHWTGGMWSVRAGGCYPMDKSAVLYGSCHKGDAFDRGRGQCKEW